MRSCFPYLLLFFSLRCLAAPIISIEQTGDGRFSLVTQSDAFVIQGAGGNGSKQSLQAAGGNSFRTWKIDENTEALLDEAESLGLMVALGFWMGHERHGFSYESFEQVQKQEEQLRTAVMRYRDHPALLLWSLGNEMEGFESGDSPAIWTQVEHLARVVKELDPNHPVMTVTAGIGGNRVPAINQYCPSIDIHGINCYGGIATLFQDYRNAGGKRPYIVTEYGPPGSWETPQGKWGMPREWTSTEKANFYRKGFEAIRNDPLCLGSFAFYWGAKQEASATWFGMLLPSGERLGAVDVLQQYWSGKAPNNRCPEISALEIEGANELLEPGGRVDLVLRSSDPEGDPLSAEWIVTEDWKEIAEGGDSRPSPPAFPDAVIKGDSTGASVKVPKNGGTYRVYAILRDGKGGAATASISLKVRGLYQAGASARATLPINVTEEFVPSGWMGDTDKMKLTLRSKENPAEGESCIKLAFTEPAGWGGMVWQSPAGDWGDQPGGFDMTGASRLSFHARGAKGGEKASFGIGIIEEDKPFFDTARESLELILSADWKQYTIDLKGKDLSRIKSGFYIVTESHGLPFELFVDEVVVE